MKAQLPKRLNKEPLLDAVFELRFNSVAPASSILPGILFSKLSGEKNIEKLAAAQIPEQVRAADPNLQFAPVVRLSWGNFVILISDRSMAVACKIPYPRWTAFKSAILESMGHLHDAKIIMAVHRYALKYVDIIPSDSIKEQVSFVNLELSVGNHKLEQEPFQVKIELPRNGLVNLVQIVSNAEVVTKDKARKKGIIVDIDTVKNVNNIQIQSLMDVISDELENMHDTNCEIFFSCLKQETISLLEPIYE